MIELKKIKKIYKSKKGISTTALNDINVNLGKTGMVFIVGKSGSGKSTLLNILGGLDNPTSGEVIVNGKNIDSFKNSEYDAYRNTYIGFIFQEFNILEQYNVYENIELSLKLQNKKTKKEEIDCLLSKLGLENLGTRKINELSGGQKQRVAIARVLIKNPQIILADEPTGNLDQKSSKQIFDILHEVSKEKLVIVVSHDMESAKNYASRIIEISDGEILFDSNPNTEIDSGKFELKKSKLPFLYALKMTLNSFKVKPLKLFMTILLTTISLIFMGFTINCVLFDKTMFITQTMKSNKNYEYSVYKTEFGKRGSMINLILQNDDINEIKKITNSKLNIVYSLYDNGSKINFEFGKNDNKNRYFDYELSDFNFIEIKDNRLVENIIGSKPEKNNEIVVHKYFADYMIEFGIMSYDNKLYKPKNYNDIITQKQKIKLGNNGVIITGIIDDDNSLFEKAKINKTFDSEKLYNYFYNSFAFYAQTIYVNGFVDAANLRVDKNSLLNKVTVHGGKRNEDNFISNRFKSLKNRTNVITEKGEIEISNLTKDEVVLSIDSIKKLDKEFDSKFNNFLSLQKNKSYDENLNEFSIQYLKDNSLNIKLTIFLEDILENKNVDVPVKLRGISLNDDYISNKYIEEYNPILKKIYSVKIYDDNLHNLSKSLNKFKYRNFIDENKDIGVYYNYVPNIDNSSEIANIIGTYKSLSIYILVVSLVFVLFTFLLFSNFIALSISYCKKEIGILRAIGATSKDVIKIFGYESIIIALISWILSIIGWIKICSILNDSMFSNNYYILNGIITHPLVPITMLVYTLAIAIMITIISINRVTKIKPIDAINNK